jgi:mannose-6-phosphate isomerase-like protein (cupin superfamily)
VPTDGPAGDDGRTPAVAGRADRQRGRSALEGLVGDVDGFLADVWSRRPLLTRGGDPAGSGRLLSVAEVDALLAERGQRTPAVRLVRGGETVPADRYTTTGRIGSRQVPDLLDAALIQAEFAAGATISLQGLHRYWPPLTELCRSLEGFLSHPFQANAYLSPPGAQGLRVHHDTHDVFVVQVEGSKHFDVYEPILELPVNGQHWSADEPPGEPLLSVDLRPGDCLYMPRGWRHRAFTTDAPSLHLTVGAARPHLAGAAHGGRRPARRRRRVPPAAAGRVRARPGRLHRRRRGPPQAARRLHRRPRPEDVADRLLRRAVTGRPTVALGGLTRLVEGVTLTSQTLVRRRPGTPCLLREAAGRVDVVLPDRTVTFPAVARAAVRALVDGDGHTADSLPGSLDAAGRLVVVRRLVTEGLLEPA